MPRRPLSFDGGSCDCETAAKRRRASRPTSTRSRSPRSFRTELSCCAGRVSPAVRRPSTRRSGAVASTRSGNEQTVRARSSSTSRSEAGSNRPLCPRCSDVLRLARRAAGAHGVLATVVRAPAIVIETDGTAGPPTAFGAYGEDPDAPYLTTSLEMTTSFVVRSAASYGASIGGSFKAPVEIDVDGQRVGRATGELNWPGTFASIGSIRLGPGSHVLAIPVQRPESSAGQRWDAAVRHRPDRDQPVDRRHSGHVRSPRERPHALRQEPRLDRGAARLIAAYVCVSRR